MSIAAGHSSRSVKELFQPLKHLMLGAMSANSQNVFQLLDLLAHLFTPRILVDQQPDTAGISLADRHAQDALDVVGAAREHADDVRHDAGVIVHIKLKDRAGQSVVFRFGN